MFQTLFVYGLLINIIDFPYDNGANVKGSNIAYDVLKNDLSTNGKLKINKIYNLIANEEHPRMEFGDAFLKCKNTLETGNFPLLIGGDHTTAISNIFASNEYSLYNKENLGILWLDAHPDFNTMISSVSKNLHGMPVSILCGHTMQMFSFGRYLYPTQFLYYGIRDIDSLEFYRLQEYNMNILDNEKQLQEWCNKFDKIHISFDLDVLDPSIISNVNTPSPNGLTCEDIKKIFYYIKNTNKLQSLDLVEYNPQNGIGIGNDNNIIIELLECLF